MTILEKTEIEKEEYEKMEDEILKWAAQYAEEHGWSLNYDERQLKAVIRGLVRNRTKHGEQYCPCRIRSGDTEVDKEIMCPCIYHENELVQQGHCHCNLFFDDKFFEELLKKQTKGPKQPILEMDA
jgi:ferredoxin-thioredoxin reductase catalytic chain